jgi:hypothetical protein
MVNDKVAGKTKYLALIVEILFLVNPGFAQKIVAIAEIAQ